MKRCISIVALCFCLLVAGVFAAGVPVAKATNGLDNFQRQNTLSPDTFSDVSVEDWFYADLRNVYEYGLMLGESATVFDPEGNITIAQAVAVAARVHFIYHSGTTDFQQGEPWYQVYVDYASANGIPANWSNYDKEATRAEYAQILAAALPDEALETINQIEDGAIPDVPLSAPWSREVYKLYRAGILLGIDNEGTYLPDSSIKRSEVAAIVSRMVNRDTRIRKDLGSVTVPSQPIESIQDTQPSESTQTTQPSENTQDPQPIDKNLEPSLTGDGYQQEGPETAGSTWQPEDPNAGHQQGTAVPGQQVIVDPNMMGTVGDGQTQPSDTDGGRSDASETGIGQTVPEVAITAPAFMSETIEVSPGDQNIPLTISLKNNPGVTSVGLLVSFDERLTLQSAQVSNWIGGQSVLSPTMSNPLKLIWVDGLKDMVEDGIIATLTFDVPTDIPAGSYQVVLKCLQDDTFNTFDQDVPFSVVNGAIVVK